MKQFDRWILGEGFAEPGRWYAIHPAEPVSFICEIVDSGDYSAEKHGLCFDLLDDQRACNFEFISGHDLNEPGVRQAVVDLMGELALVLRGYDRRVSRRVKRDSFLCDDLDEDIRRESEKN